MKKFVFICVSIILCLIYNAFRENEHDKNIERLKSKFTGYQLVYDTERNLLTLTSPQGETRWMNLSSLVFVYIYKRNASDSADKQEYYAWIIHSEDSHLYIPYFAVDPNTVISIFHRLHPEIDSVWFKKKINEFEHKEFNICTLWHKGGRQALQNEVGYNQYGYNYCDRD